MRFFLTPRRHINGQADNSCRTRSRLVAMLLVVVTVLWFAAACAKPFRTDAALKAYFSTRPGTEAVAVFNAVTGATYAYNGQVHFVTASTVKVAILGAVLLRAQEAKRPLTAWERARAVPMIESSNNDSASLLYASIGRAPALARFMSLVGMSNTIPGPGTAWGLTQTTALDEVTLMRAIAYPNNILTTASRNYALTLMSHPDKDHRWGVSAGAGPGQMFAQKTGSGPVSVYGGKWAVNCIGRIWGGGRDFVIAALTAGSPNKSVGVATVENAVRIATRGIS